MYNCVILFTVITVSQVPPCDTAFRLCNFTDEAHLSNCSEENGVGKSLSPTDQKVDATLPERPDEKGTVKTPPPSEENATERSHRLPGGNGADGAHIRSKGARLLEENGTEGVHALSDGAQLLSDENGTEEAHRLPGGNDTDGASSGGNSTDESPLLSDTTYNMVTGVLMKLNIPVIVIGMVLNTINICVFCRKTMRSNTNAYLLANSISQLLYSLLMIPYTIKWVTHGSSPNLFSIMFGVYVANYVAVVFRRFTFIITCVVSMERFLVTTTPLKAKQYRLVHSPGQFITGVFLFSVLVNVHSLIRNTVITNHKDGITTYSVRNSGFFKNHEYMVRAWSTTAKVLAVYLAITTAFIFNIVVVISLRRQRQFRQNITNTRVADKMKAREKQTTVTILVTNCLYLVLSVPMVSNAMAFDLSPVYGYFSVYYKNVYMVIQDLGSTCVLLGLSVDFFSHMMLSEMYRATFLCMFKPKCVAEALTHSEYKLEDSEAINFRSISNVTLTSHMGV